MTKKKNDEPFGISYTVSRDAALLSVFFAICALQVTAEKNK